MFKCLNLAFMSSAAPEGAKSAVSQQPIQKKIDLTRFFSKLRE